MPLRRKILFFGWITLLIFPIPGFLLRLFIDDVSFLQFLEIDNIKVLPIGLGLELGFVYGFFAYLLMQAPFFDIVPLRIDKIVEEMNLKLYHGLFLSICAGIGEEFLFRAGMQHYLGIIFTSFFFVALHGYLNPMNWRFSIYGLIILPFIFAIAIGYQIFGIWFAIAAHFSYDAVLFTIMIKGNKNVRI
jgi:membrane protease YdiL (CAAX protease family)